jgi:PBP1b-binding outer membrane lipoprotein LpoB
MKNLIWITLIALLLVACGPSEAQIQKAIEETQSAQASTMAAVVATEGAHQTATAMSVSAKATLEAFCGKERVSQSIEEMDDILTRYLDDFELASNTGRISLSPIVSKMQDKYQDVRDMSVPTCLNDARDYLSSSMKQSTQGFLSFMAQDANSVVSSYFDKGSNLIKKYADEKERVLSCAPDCAP